MPVSRKTAQVLEENLLQRVRKNVSMLSWVFNPLDARLYDASSKNIDVHILTSPVNIIDLVKQHARANFQKIYEELPRNQIVYYEISHRHLFTQRIPKVALVASCLSPIVDLIKKGESDSKMGVEDLDAVKKQVNVDENVFYFICAFSTTGWQEETKNHLVGKNYLVALADYTYELWRTYFAPYPMRWHETKLAFDLSTNQEKIDAIKKFTQQHTYELIMDKLTVDFVSEKLYLPKSMVIMAFKMLESSEMFLRYEDTSYPPRLVRI